jgi:mRNA-degrading endonuclease HigB of HigAB toxin-antitoxin module
VKATFGQTDRTKVRSGQTVCVFDIGGNKFRLVAFVSYAKGKVYVLRVMTHKEYDKGNQQWKDHL